MTRIIYPIFEAGDNYFKITKHRFFATLTPIQKTKEKQSDFAAYLAAPLMDAFILEPLYTLEVAIHLLNAIASLGRACYVWTMKQQKSQSLIDEKTSKEMGDAVSHIGHALSGLVAQTLNTLLSVLSLITRPLASIAHAIVHHTPSYSSPSLLPS